MARAYISENQVLSPNITVGSSETNTVVSKLFAISHEGSRNLRLKVTAANVTAGAGVTLKLQHASGDADTFITTTKSTSITGNGDFYLTLNVEVSGDQAELPLMPLARAVITTGAGGATAKITSVNVVQGV